MPKLSVKNLNQVDVLRRKGQTKFIVKATPQDPEGLPGRVVIHDNGEIAASAAHQFIFKGLTPTESKWGESYKCIATPTTSEVRQIMDALFGLVEIKRKK